MSSMLVMMVQLTRLIDFKISRHVPGSVVKFGQGNKKPAKLLETVCRAHGFTLLVQAINLCS